SAEEVAARHTDTCARTRRWSPGNSWAWAWLGQACEGIAEPREAANCYRRAIRLERLGNVYVMCMYNVRLQLLISPEQRRRLEIEAKRRKTSVASVIREAIDARLGSIAPDERIRAVEEIGHMKGRFLPPRELRRLIDEEREQ